MMDNKKSGINNGRMIHEVESLQEGRQQSNIHNDIYQVQKSAPTSKKDPNQIYQVYHSPEQLHEGLEHKS